MKHTDPWAFDPADTSAVVYWKLRTRRAETACVMGIIAVVAAAILALTLGMSVAEVSPCQ